MAILCLASDADRGSLGVGNAAVEIICHDVSMHCLDVIDNPGLEKLDLRKCQAPFHLTVRGCPRLGLVLLPENGMGAVVHWDFGADAAAACAITGPIRQFDSCQDDGRTTRVIARDSGFASALIVLSDAPLPECSAPMELLICLAHSAQYVGSWIGAQNRLREAVFNGTDIDPHATFDAPLLRALTIEGASSLDSLKVPPSLEALEIIDCPRIAHIMASGKRLRIEGGCAPDLRIHGGWDFGQFCKTSSRLAPAMVKHLAADRCRHIRPDHLSLENATNPLAVLPDPDCIRDPKWRGLMLDFVMHTANSASILPALKLARALYDTGLPAVDAWHARTCLYANLGQAKPARRDAIDWVWHIPRDLAAEVYEADLVLGLACWGATFPNISG